MEGWDLRALAVLERLNAAGHRAVLVGGCVRDRLMGRTPHDYDAATSARPEQIREACAPMRVVETGVRHGTVTVLSGGLPVEVTTFRREGRYTDHRRPDRVEFTGDLGEDLARRDFTINAMAWEPSGLTDPFGGRADLAAGVIRCVGEPERRFGEDALRLLRVVETGVRHGTVTVLSGGLPVEVTTFRREGRYTDHRRPDRVEFTGDLGEDLARRDFTINAMAWEPSGLTDPFGGRADLAAGVIRCVGEPERRFGEDALRLLRALRFAAQLDFRLEEGTAAGVRACAPQLACVSRERVAEELKRLVCGPAAGRVLLDCPEVLTGQVLPELAPAVGFDQRNPHHSYDVYTHCVRALERVPAEPGLRLAALLHDVGKPGCCTVDREGVGHFYGHAAAGAELADACLRRLRLDNALRERVVTLIRRHDLQLEPEPRLVKRWLGRLGPELFFQWTALAKADAGAKFPDRAPGAARWEQVEALARQILAERPCLTLRDLEADGNDALARGLRGPAVGRALAALLEEVMEGRLPNHRAELMAELDRLAGRER